MTIGRSTTILPTAIFLCWAALVLDHSAAAADRAEVAVPRDHDKYSAFVAQLERGETKINFSEFRESFLESQRFKSASEQKPDLSTLRKQVPELMQMSRYAEIIDLTKKMLSIDYTDIEAHKILQQTYRILGDEPNSKKYHDIEFGLLNSIVKKGDGKTCQTAWPVVQINEEYFILQMLGAELKTQSVDHTGGVCDKMEVQTDQGKKVYYFDISKVFKGYETQGIH